MLQTFKLKRLTVSKIELQALKRFHFRLSQPFEVELASGV